MKSTILLLISLTPALFGEETALELDPAQTQIQFTLSATLHTVHGSFKLRRGAIHYDFASGKCSGEIVIDAQSGNSGNETRDKKMHKSVLESDRYPEIVFLPDHIEGNLSRATIHGAFRIHGSDHETTLALTSVPNGSQIDITTQFVIPYVAWGMKNPSTLFLHVGDKVEIEVRAQGRIQTAAPNAATSVLSDTPPSRYPVPGKSAGMISHTSTPARQFHLLARIEWRNRNWFLWH
jgi:polyisoprenoid-binding protein YceI